MRVSTMSDVGALARSARLAHGMTQADLAQRLRVSRDWVVRLEKGHPRLEAHLVLGALQVLGVQLETTSPANHDDGRGPQRAARRQPSPRGTGEESSVPTPVRGTKQGDPDPFDELFGTKGTG